MPKFFLIFFFFSVSFLFSYNLDEEKYKDFLRYSNERKTEIEKDIPRNVYQEVRPRGRKFGGSFWVFERRERSSRVDFIVLDMEKWQRHIYSGTFSSKNRRNFIKYLEDTYSIEEGLLDTLSIAVNPTQYSFFEEGKFHTLYFSFRKDDNDFYFLDLTEKDELGERFFWISYPIVLHGVSKESLRVKKLYHEEGTGYTAVIISYETFTEKKDAHYEDVILVPRLKENKKSREIRKVLGEKAFLPTLEQKKIDILEDIFYYLDTTKQKMHIFYSLGGNVRQEVL